MEKRIRITFLLFQFCNILFAGPLLEGQNSQSFVPTAELGCRYREGQYEHGQLVQTTEPCLNCTCTRGVLICYLRVCPTLVPPSPDCFANKAPSDCCATMICNSINSSKKNESLIIKSHFSGRTMNDPVPVYKKAEEIEVATSYTVYLPTISESTTTIRTTVTPYREKMSKMLTSDSLMFVTSTEIPSDLNHINAISGGCYVNGSIYAEGSAMMSSSFCEYCYCIRGKQMCIRPKCHLSIEGCSPRYFSQYTCCPTRYMCSEKNKIFRHTSSTTTSTTATTSTTTTTTTTTTTIPPSPTIETSSELLFKTTKPICQLDGVIYQVGDPVPSITHCQTCYCSSMGKVLCTSVTCSPAMDGCQPIIPEGHCCPLQYKCNFTQIPANDLEVKSEFKEKITILPTINDTEELNTTENQTYDIEEYTKSSIEHDKMDNSDIPEERAELDISLPSIRENDRIIYLPDFAENLRRRISEASLLNHNMKSSSKGPFHSFLQRPILYKDLNERYIYNKHRLSMIPRRASGRERSHSTSENLEFQEPHVPSSVLFSGNINMSDSEESLIKEINEDLNSSVIVELENTTDLNSSITVESKNTISTDIEPSSQYASTENSSMNISFTEQDSLPSTEITIAERYTRHIDGGKIFKEETTEKNSTIDSTTTAFTMESSPKNIWYSEPDVTPLTEEDESTKLDDKKRPRQKDNREKFSQVMEVIPFLAQDAITSHPYIQRTRNRTQVLKPSTTIDIITGHCFINNKVYINGELIGKNDPCLLCRCFYGEELCQRQKCPQPPMANCKENYLQEFCCPRYICGENLESTTERLIETSPEIIFIPDQLRTDSISSHTPTDIEITDATETIERTTESYTSTRVTSDISVTDREQEIETTTNSWKITEENKVVTELPTEDDKSDLWALLRVSGCNIYGKYYKLNEEVFELGNECKSCICTQNGVQCSDLC